MPAGVALHDLAHGRVGEFLYVEKGFLHGSFLLLWSFGKPFLAGFEASLARSADEDGERNEVTRLLHAEHVVFFVADDAVFLLICHGYSILKLLAMSCSPIRRMACCSS